MSHPIDLPGAPRVERDTDGRLVGLVFDSTPPLPAPATNPWLVAVDSSDNALRAVAHAAAGRRNERLRAASGHVQPWLSLEAAEAELAHRAWQPPHGRATLLDAAASRGACTWRWASRPRKSLRWPGKSVVPVSSSAAVG
jgi:hypothetical protein